MNGDHQKRDSPLCMFREIYTVFGVVVILGILGLTLAHSISRCTHVLRGAKISKPGLLTIYHGLPTHLFPLTLKVYHRVSHFCPPTLVVTLLSFFTFLSRRTSLLCDLIFEFDS